jgi:hypothetical protein
VSKRSRNECCKLLSRRTQPVCPPEKQATGYKCTCRAVGLLPDEREQKSRKGGTSNE